MALSAGSMLFSLIALFTMIGPYAADWNETHVKNPNWPPHARFHNGQTMSTGLLIGLLTLYYTHTARAASEKKVHLNFVLVLVHLYYVPALSGILYPGALWMDPEFGNGAPQLRGFSGLLAVAWGAWWLERRKLEGLEGKRE
ncbi:hypothetical protein P171DRAFT_474796 [Karstenula rhodostoma CBS 690.94]|uniref:Acetyltransferase n=1 Tax=Karstenula rhodostoma CBS 690.94 TaxID=1392251 RepID=A0A9P4PFY3_9PLEO|nr:hypothetical protein P171DRAFT_474796 [Karstenula rhodostoma CBS 690.94]